MRPTDRSPTACATLLWTVLSAAAGLRSPAALAQPAATRPVIALLDAVTFVDAQHGWAAGTGILATRDGGRTWTRQRSPAATISALDVVSTQDGWALGTTASETAVLLRTTDGGVHWRTAREPSGPFYLAQLLSIRFVSSTRGVGVASSNATAGGGWIVTTADGGQTWTALTTPGTVTAACAAPGRGPLSDIWAVAQQGDTVWHTTTGGRSWLATLTAGPGYMNGGQIACLSPSTVWVTLDGGYGMSQHSYTLYRTGDAGAQWRVVVAERTAGAGPAPGTSRTIPGPGIYREVLSAPSGTTAYLASGCVACGAGTTAVGHTLDSGRTWHNEPSIPGVGYDVNLAVSFPTARQGWLVMTTMPPARTGLILATADAGRTWTRQ